MSTSLVLLFMLQCIAPFAYAQSATSTASATSSVIESGDAFSATDAVTEVNTNILDPNATSSEPTSTPAFGFLTGSSTEASSTASTTPETDGSPLLPVPSLETTASNTNAATIQNDASTSAATGKNAVSGDQAVVETGNAYAFANIVNIANTNIYDSTGLIKFLSQYFGVSSVDLRDSFSLFENGIYHATSVDPCSLEGCSDSNVHLSVANGNDASITNNIVSVADTGGNSASSSGDSVIATGNAYAGANIINVANTNITDANYLMITLNNVGDLFGDIVLPGKNFFSTYFSNLLANTANTTVQNTNTAAIVNNVSTAADSGNNTATSTGGSATIATGDATSDTSVYNAVNQNYVNSDSVVILLRVHGNWAGNIFGLPDNITWAQTPDGIELFNKQQGDASTSAPNAEKTAITNTNNASITNNVQVYALTGDNKVSAGGDGAVTTGDAHASTNIVNVANTNILGHNWMFLVFNIFGNWNGDLSFGRPDLWLGASAKTESDPLTPGRDVTYTFTVKNRGDADAHNVKLGNIFNEGLIQPQGAYEKSGSGASTSAAWDLGTIPAGETKTFSYTAQVSDTLPLGETPITLDANVTSTETDNNPEDNADYVTVMGENLSHTPGGNPMIGFKSKLNVTQTASAAKITASSSVDYHVTVHNAGGPAYFSVLVDRLTDPNGKVLHEEVWQLDTIKSGETIHADYTLNFNASTTLGTYRNEAMVYATDHVRSLKEGDQIISNKAPVDVEVVDSLGQVLGAEACPAYITTFMRRGSTGADVLRLQQFLSSHEQLEVPQNGIFDRATAQAVEAFQTRYRSDVLDPWGMSTPTGYVYLTTKKKVNELNCQDGQEFPLTLTEQSEISSYHDRTALSRTRAPHEELTETKNDPHETPTSTETAMNAVPKAGEEGSVNASPSSATTSVIGGMWSWLRSRLPWF